MRVTTADLHKLALKLIETFSRQDQRQRGFERYWPLVGPLQTFSEHAAGELEQELAKALQNALEAALKRLAPQSFHIDADSVALLLNAKPLTARPYKPRRKSNRRG